MGAEYTGRDEGHSNSVTRKYAVANGVTVNNGDLVYLDSNGRVSNASIAGKRLLGQVQGGDTESFVGPNNTAVGNSAGTVKVLVNIERDARYLMKHDGVGGAADATSVGKYFDVVLVGSDQQVDTSTKSAVSGQLYCLEFNPGIRGTDNTYGLFRLAEKQETVDDIGAS